MTIPGFTDQELADLARKKGASEESVRKWLAGMLVTHALTVNNTPIPAPEPDRGRTGQKRASTACRSEASVQRDIVMALKAAGFYVRRIGQRNAKGTMDPGVPDVYALRRYTIAPPRAGRAIWIEVKAPKRGRQSRAQREFQRQCEAAGVRYILAKSVDDIRELIA